MGIPGDTCCCGSRVTTDPYGWWQYYGNVPDGNYCDAGPFDGCGPAEYTLAQDVTLPMGVTTVEFDWAYDIDNWGQPREMRVDVEPVGGGQPLERFVVQQIQGSQWSQWRHDVVDLSGFFGQTVRISFEFYWPECYSGPGCHGFDNVILKYFDVPLYEESFRTELDNPEYPPSNAWDIYSSQEEGKNERVTFSPILAEVNPFTNPSFETGNTNGWIVDNSWHDWTNQRVWGATSNSNWNSYFDTVPDGNYYYHVEMDTCCNERDRHFAIGQDIQLPENAAEIHFDYGYFFETCCGWGDPFYIRVDIEPSGGGNPLDSFILYENNWDSWGLHKEDTASFDVSNFGGQEVRINFKIVADWWLYVWGQFSLDNFVLYELQDLGFQPYDDDHCWKMEKDETRNGGANLNEITLHLGLVDAGNVELSFVTQAFGDDLTPDPLPASFEGHSNGDGVAISTDGFTWYTIWQYQAGLNDWTEIGPLDINGLMEANGGDICETPTDREDLYIKFQQYGDGLIPDNGGIVWDLIHVEGDGDGWFIFNVPRIEIDATVTPELPEIFAQNQGEPDFCTMKVNLTTHGEAGETAAEEVRFTYTRPQELILDGNPLIEEITWSSADVPPPGDLLEAENHFELINSEITADDSYLGPLGMFDYSYEEWDGDFVSIEQNDLGLPTLRVMSFDHAEMWGEFIANNDDPGNIISMEALDDFGLPMPPQDFDSWGITGLDGIDVVVDNVIDPETGQPFPHKKNVKITGGEPGDEGILTVRHVPEDQTLEFPIELTWGEPTEIDAWMQGSYQYGLEGVLVAYIKDEWGNTVEDYAGSSLYFLDLQIPDGGSFEVTGDNFVEFDGGQRGVCTFYITPRGDWYEEQGDPPWYPGFRLANTSGNIGPQHIWLDDIMTVHAGPTVGFHMETAQTELYAGMPFNLFVQARDETNHNNMTYTAPLIFSHNCDGTEDLEPVPWKDAVGTVRYDMVDGQYDGGHDFYFNKSGGWSIGVKSGLNYAIAGSLNIDVMPGELNYLAPTPDPSAIVDPNIVADGRLLIPVSGDHVFDAIGYDAFGNLIDGFEITDWDVIDDIGEISEGEFHALAYFSFDDKTGVKEGEYIFKDGAVRVTGVGPLGVEVSHDILIRVYNPLNIWLVPDEIEPSGILLDHPLELKVPVHYYTPYENFPDNLQLKISAYIITDVDNNLNAIGGEHLIFTSGAPNTTFRLINLNEPGNVGIATYSFLIPYESIAGVIDHDQENKDNTNWLKVVIEDVPGGGEMGDFQWNLADDESKTELYAVYAPPPSETPSFAPAMAIMVLALLGGAVVANLYASSGDKKGRKDEDGVSPVIAIILMVAITIVLAGVLWLWVSGLVDTQKSNDIEYVDTAWESPTLQNDYQLIIENVKDKEFSVEDLEFSLMDGNKVDKSMGQHKVTAIYGKSIDNETIVSFHDGDHDGYLSTGDRFIIKSEDHVNYDGTPDPGEARAGYYFALKTKDNELFEVQIEQ